jgi:transposase
VARRAAQPGLNPVRLVCLDGSGFSTNMARRQGRSPRGKRFDSIVAPLVIDHPMNGITFRAYIEQNLAPRLTAGDIVVCDKLQCHKGPGVRAAIKARGTELRFLLPYSPDLNPIEQVFAKLKNLVRTAPQS